MFDNKIFWREDFDIGLVKGGFYIRAIDIKQFLDKVEQVYNGGEIVGLRFDGNDLEVIVEAKEGELP